MTFKTVKTTSDPFFFLLNLPKGTVLTLLSSFIFDDRLKLPTTVIHKSGCLGQHGCMFTSSPLCGGNYYILHIHNITISTFTTTFSCLVRSCSLAERLNDVTELLITKLLSVVSLISSSARIKQTCLSCVTT